MISWKGAKVMNDVMFFVAIRTLKSFMFSYESFFVAFAINR